MQQADLELAELAGAQPFGLLGGGLGLELLASGFGRRAPASGSLLHQRTNDVGLPTLAQPLADELIRAGSLLLPHHPGGHGLSAGGKLAKDGCVEVAVRGQREGARDRGRGHVESVRRRPIGPLGVERRPLSDPEAVLLVDDTQRQPVEGDVGLDQGMRPDDHPELARRKAGERVTAACGRCGAGEQGERDRSQALPG